MILVQSKEHNMTQQDPIERQKWFVNLRLGQFIHFNSAPSSFIKPR